ncbi:MAG: TIGR04076 family protein [Candidatus Heimdallarchaeota archaeon]
MAKVKITVIKKFKSKDVFGKDYKNLKGEIIPECPVFEEGQVLISKDAEKPEGFCGFGWRAIQPELMVLSFGGNFWESWTEPGTMYVACPDGIRPVSFKLEKIED